jgi:hypothetical protein
MGFISQFMEVITIVHPDPLMLNTPWTEWFKRPQRCLNPLLHHSFPKWCVHHVRSLYIYIMYLFVCISDNRIFWGKMRTQTKDQTARKHKESEQRQTYFLFTFLLVSSFFSIFDFWNTSILNPMLGSSFFWQFNAVSHCVHKTCFKENHSYHSSKLEWWTHTNWVCLKFRTKLSYRTISKQIGQPSLVAKRTKGRKRHCQRSSCNRFFIASRQRTHRLVRIYIIYSIIWLSYNYGYTDRR